MKKRKEPFQPPPGPLRSAADTGLDVLGWAVSSGSVGQVLDTLRARHRRRRRRRLATIACAALVLGITGFTWQARPPSRLIPVAVVPSAIVSLPAWQMLPDGSRIELKDGADFAVEFNADVRRVVLRKGEAHFDVTKDVSRHFVVAAGGGVEVRAIGTAFSVERGETHVDVMVTEGRVSVAAGAANVRDRRPETGDMASPGSRSSSVVSHLSPEVIVDAGRRVIMEVGEAPAAPPLVREVSAEEQRERLAWRVPRLEFSGTPLGEAIPMFNQHGRVRLVLDPALGELQMSGILRADDTDSLLLLLKYEFGIEPQLRNDGAVILLRP